MFECRCRPGFSGNGRFCRDIDECADKKLNDCDLRSSYCLNLPGSYQCKCRPGFRPDSNNNYNNNNNDNLDTQPTAQILAAESEALNASSTTLEEIVKRQPASGRGCRDINECSDGKLNRCHQQAKCINLEGSYKCRCRRGYLGNGFECHQWFSSQPGVAAYLHRHQSDPQSSSTNKTGGSRGALNVPLSSLVDPDDDPADRARDELDSLEYKYEDDNDNGNGDGDDDASNKDAANQDRSADDEAAQDLADSRWEPLRFAEQTHVFQQVSSSSFL